MVFYYHKGTMNDWRERVSDMKVLVTPRDGMRTRFLDGIHARESMTLTEDMFTMDGYILPSGTKIYV